MTQTFLTNAQQKFLEKIDALMFFFFCVLIYFLPISIALVESFSGVVIFLYMIKKVVWSSWEIAAQKRISSMSAGQVIKSFWGRLFPKNFLNLSLVFFLIIVAVSVFKSQMPDISQRAFVNKVLEQYFLFFSFIECMSSRRRIFHFIGVYMISSVVVCLSGFYQSVFGFDFLRGNQIFIGRVTSSLRHANDFGAYIVISLGIPLLAVFYRKEFQAFITRTFPKSRMRNIWIWLFALALGLLIVCLGLTFSRGSWVGFFAGIIFLCVFDWKNFRVVLTLLAVAFIFVFMPLLGQKRNVSFLSDNLLGQNSNIQEQLEAELLITDSANRMTSPESWENSYRAIEFKTRRVVYSAVKAFTGAGRRGFWQEAINIIKDYPFFGAGLNTYSRVVHQYKINWGGYPHNCFLQMGAETGLLGLGSFLFIIFILFRTSIRFYRCCQDAFIKIVLLGALTGMFSFLTQSFFDTTLYSLQLGNLMWIVMGLIVAVQMLPKEQNA